NEINGLDHTGSSPVGVPAIFGMNFQAVSVGQKLAGYIDAVGTPTAGLQDALDHTDASLGKMIGALKQNHLWHSTAIIVTAKHGQAPIDVSTRKIISNKLIPAALNQLQSGLVAQGTLDDVALLWLTDQSMTAAAVSALLANQVAFGIQSILSGSS